MIKKELVYGAFKRIKAPVRQGFTLIESRYTKSF